MSLTPEQASLGILSCVIHADGDFSDEEQDLLVLLANRHPFFRDMYADEFRKATEISVDGINENGWKRWATLCNEALPPRYVPTVFALAADFSLIDGEPKPGEVEMIRQLKEIMGVPDDVFENILNVMCFKNGIVE